MYYLLFVICYLNIYLNEGCNKIKGEGKLVLFVPRLTAGTDGPAPVRKLDLKKHEKSKNKEKRKKINKTKHEMMRTIKRRGMMAKIYYEKDKVKTVSAKVYDKIAMFKKDE